MRKIWNPLQVRMKFIVSFLVCSAVVAWGQTLRLATLNVWSGLDYKGTWSVGEFEEDSTREKRLTQVIIELQHLKPDVIALQECNPVATVARTIAEAMDFDCIYVRANGGIKVGRVGIPWNLNEGIALLARKGLGLEFLDVIDLSQTFGVLGNGVSLHFSDQNIALIGSVKSESARILVVTTHLSAAVPDEERTRAKLTELMLSRKMGEDEKDAVLSEFMEQADIRSAEVARLNKFLEARISDTPVILAGDFNTGPESEEMKILHEQFLDCTAPGGNKPTWDAAKNPNLTYSTRLNGNNTVLEDLSAWYDGISRRIDHIFIDQHFTPEDVRSIALFADKPHDGLYPSDHFGLIAEINLSRLTKQESTESIRSGGEKFEFLPLFSYDTDVGFGYGVKGFFLDFLAESESFDVILFNSTKGERWYRLVFSIPDFELRQGKRYPLSIDLIADYDKYTKNNFFGVGPESRSSDRETYTKEPLELQIVASRGFSERFVGQFGVRFRAVRNFGYDSSGSFAQTAPVNLGRSQGLTFVSSVRYDSRDSYINPSRGNVAQLDLEAGSSGFGSDYDLFSSTVSLQTYHVLFYPKTIFAARIVSQTVSGTDLPLHAYSTLGGTKTLRGFPQDRFLDRASILTNFELRFPIIWRFDGLLFFDAGKLASNIGRLAPMKGGWKTNPGFGLRLMMDTFVVRADLGISSEGTGFYFNFGHLF